MGSFNDLPVNLSLELFPLPAPNTQTSKQTNTFVSTSPFVMLSPLSSSQSSLSRVFLLIPPSFSPFKCISFVLMLQSLTRSPFPPLLLDEAFEFSFDRCCGCTRSEMLVGPVPCVRGRAGPLLSATAFWPEIAREWRVLRACAISGLFLSLVVVVVYVLLLILRSKRSKEPDGYW